MDPSNDDPMDRRDERQDRREGRQDKREVRADNRDDMAVWAEAVAEEREVLQQDREDLADIRQVKADVTLFDLAAVVRRTARVTFALLVLLAVLGVVTFAGSVAVDQLGTNLDRNSDNIAALTVATAATREDARRTREALTSALEEAQGAENDAFVAKIKEALEAVRRIEAKLDELGGR